MSDKHNQICVLLKCGQWLPINYKPGDTELLRRETEALTENLFKNPIEGARYCRGDEFIRWGFRLDELAGFYVRQIDNAAETITERQERHMNVMEKAIKIAEQEMKHFEDTERWKEGGDEDA